MRLESESGSDPCCWSALNGIALHFVRIMLRFAVCKVVLYCNTYNDCSNCAGEIFYNLNSFVPTFCIKI